MFRMARWSLQGRKSCRKRYMEEWSSGEREELVVGIDEEFGEVVPPSLGVQFLSWSAARSWLSLYVCLPYILALVCPADRQEALQLS